MNKKSWLILGLILLCFAVFATAGCSSYRTLDNNDFANASHYKAETFGGNGNDRSSESNKGHGHGHKSH